MATPTISTTTAGPWLDQIRGERAIVSVSPRERSPNTTAMAEVHTLIEPPLIYCYHTLRYGTAERDNVEDIGVQVLAFQRPFCIRMPVLRLAELAPGTASALAATPPLSLEHVAKAALTVEFVGAKAGAGLRLEWRASANGVAVDTVAYAEAVLRQSAGGLVRQTVPVPDGPAFLKAIVHNLDAEQTLRDVQMTAILRG